jgi:hypothetical protein
MWISDKSDSTILTVFLDPQFGHGRGVLLGTFIEVSRGELSVEPRRADHEDIGL